MTGVELLANAAELQRIPHECRDNVMQITHWLTEPGTVSQALPTGSKEANFFENL
nr:hypothetical protein [Mycobacterium sp. UM_NZ2]